MQRVRWPQVVSQTVLINFSPAIFAIDPSVILLSVAGAEGWPSRFQSVAEKPVSTVQRAVSHNAIYSREDVEWSYDCLVTKQIRATGQ